MTTYEIKHNEPNPDQVIADLARDSGHSEEVIRKRYSRLFEPVTEEDISWIINVLKVDREQAESIASTTLLHLDTPEQEAQQAAEAEIRIEEVNKKVDRLFGPISDQLGSFIMEHAADDLDDRLEELRHSAFCIVDTKESSNELYDWFTSSNEELEDMPPIVMLAAGDKHQRISVSIAAMHINFADRNKRFEISSQVSEATLNPGESQDSSTS